jgi:hypothetical protein
MSHSQVDKALQRTYIYIHTYIHLQMRHTSCIHTHIHSYTYRSDTDPALLAKVGDFFMSHSQFDKAVQLFVTGKQVGRALDLCEKYNVVITEEVCVHVYMYVHWIYVCEKYNVVITEEVCVHVCLYVCMYGIELLFVTGKQVGRALDLYVYVCMCVCVYVCMCVCVYVCRCVGV